MVDLQQGPGSQSRPKAIEMFAQAHWFHSGYTLLVETAEPGELLGGHHDERDTVGPAQDKGQNGHLTKNRIPGTANCSRQGEADC
jgi:hypothetical protein